MKSHFYKKLNCSPMILLLSLLYSCSQINSFLGKQDKSFDQAKIESPISTLGPTLDQSLSFLDRTESYGLGQVMAETIFQVDLNNDGFSDLAVLPLPYSHPQFYLFDKTRKEFVIQEDLIISKSKMRATILIFNDFDGDGTADLLAAGATSKSELSAMPVTFFKGFINSKGLLTFTDPRLIIHHKLPLTGPISTIVPFDYDLDGDLDLFIGFWFDQQKNDQGLVPDQLWDNQKNSKGELSFVDRSDLLIDEHKKVNDLKNFLTAKPTSGALSCDLNRDGFPELITTSSNGYHNKLWLNHLPARTSQRQFIEVGLKSGIAADPEGLLSTKGGGRTSAVACTDYNNDGIMDVFLGEIYHSYDPSSVDKSSILTGATFLPEPEFIRTEYTLSSSQSNWHQADRRGIWFDYNLDGNQDLLIDNFGYPPESRLVLFENLADFSFFNRSQDLGIDIINPLSSHVIDVTGNNRWDLLTFAHPMKIPQKKGRLFLFENHHQMVGRGLKIYLKGKNSNRAGIGATVKLKLKRDGLFSERIFFYQQSYGTSSPQGAPYLLVAIKPGEELLGIEVLWPYFNPEKFQILTRRYNLKNYEWSFPHWVLTLKEEGNVVEGYEP